MENDALIFSEHFSPGVRHEAVKGTLEACNPRTGWDDVSLPLSLCYSIESTKGGDH
jgi:hypothetical protein